MSIEELNSRLSNAGHKIEHGVSGRLLFDGFAYPDDETVLEQMRENYQRGYRFNRNHLNRINAAMKYIQAQQIEPTAEEVDAAARTIWGEPRGQGINRELAYKVAKAVKQAGARS